MNEYFSLISFVGMLVLGAGILYVQWRTGANSGVQVASEVIDAYKTQVQQLREEIAIEKDGRQKDRHDLKNEIQALKFELERMKGADEEKEKKLGEYMQIFQGRDPQLIESMSKILEVMAEIRDYMRTTNITNDRIERGVAANQKRNVAIDKDMKDKAGNVLRKES